MFDDHHRRIGDIDAHFDYGSGDQDSNGAVPERPHDLVTLIVGHFAMHQTDAKFFEDPIAHLLRHLRGIAHLR